MAVVVFGGFSGIFVNLFLLILLSISLLLLLLLF